MVGTTDGVNKGDCHSGHTEKGDIWIHCEHPAEDGKENLPRQKKRSLDGLEFEEAAINCALQMGFDFE